MSNTSDEESAAYDDKEPEEGFGVIPLSALPELVRRALNRSKAQQGVEEAARGVIAAKEGVIEARLLPEFSLALQNDFRVTNVDALKAQHAAHEILQKASKTSKPVSFRVIADHLRYVSAVLLLEAEMQLEVGLLQEDEFPGSTTAVESLSLPSDN